MTKKIVGILVVILIVLGGYILYSEYYNKPQENIPTTTDSTNYGNSTGNLANAGYVARFNDAIYGDINSNGKGLYKSNVKLKNIVRLTDDEALYINVNDGWIYYVNYSDNQSIYKVETDGNNRTKLATSKADFLNHEGGWLYYIDTSNKGRICKLSEDGKNKKYISTDTNCTNLLVRNGYVYYLMKNCIYKMTVNGIDKKEITRMRTTPYTNGDQWRGNFDIYGSYLYFPGEDGNLYCISTDGQNKTMLTKGNVESINIYNDYIYYFATSSKTIYRIKLEGQVKLEYVIGGGDYCNINIVNNDGVMFKDKSVVNGGVFMVSMNLIKGNE